MKTSPVLSTLMCSLALAALAFSAPAQAQQREPDAPSEGMKSAVGAGVLEWFLPTAGFAYAGDWSRGLLPNAVRLGGGLVFGLSLWADASDDDDYCGTMCAVAGVAAGVGTVWAIVDAIGTAHDRNEAVARARTASGLMVTPSPHGGLSVGVRLAR